VDRPVANADRISARCDTDLSPGARISPASGPRARECKGVKKTS